MRTLIIALLVACSSSSSTTQPKTAPPAEAGSQAPASGAVLTKEECEAQGGRVNGSIGGGDQAHCNPDETEVGAVRLGIEGGWCCKPKA